MKNRGYVPAQVLALLLCLGLAGYAYSSYVFLPMVRETRALSDRLQLMSRRIGSVAEKTETLSGLRAQYERTLMSLYAIDSTVTQERGLPYFLRDLERATQVSGVSLRSLSIGAISETTPYGEVPVTIEVSGTYEKVTTFVNEILSGGRAVTVQGVRLALPEAEGEAGTVEPRTLLTATLSLVLYVVPKGGSD